jgi:hypothetical protein
MTYSQTAIKKQARQPAVSTVGYSTTLCQLSGLCKMNEVCRLDFKLLIRCDEQYNIDKDWNCVHHLC